MLGIGYHSETLDPMVVYQAQYDTEEFGSKPIWVRPLEMFLETVEVDGNNIPRFEYIGGNV